MNEEKLNVGNIVDRMKSETPVFWKKIRNAMGTLGVVGATIVAIPASVVALPAVIITVAGYCVAIGIVGAALAQTTKEK